MKKHKDKNQPVTIGDFQELRGGFQKLTGDVQTLSGDVKELRGGFKILTGDVQELRADFQEFAEFITNTAATKHDLKEFADKALKTFATKDDLKALPTKDELRNFKNDILTSNDKLAKKLDTVLTEQSAHFGGHDRMDGTLREHGSDIKHLKQRVTHLEVKAGIA